MWSTLRTTTRRARARFEAFLDQTYAAFVAGVARGRGLPEEAVPKAAEGRVWTGAQARSSGWSTTRRLRRALELASEAIGVAPERPVELRPFPPARPALAGALELLGGSRGLSARWAAGCSWLRPGHAQPAAAAAALNLATPRPAARSPGAGRIQTRF